MASSRLKDPRWMSLKDFGAKHGVDIRKLQRYAASGKLPCKKMGERGAWYVDLKKWNDLVEIYAMHEEVCTSVVTGYELGMRRFKHKYDNDDNNKKSEDE